MKTPSNKFIYATLLVARSFPAVEASSFSLPYDNHPSIPNVERSLGSKTMTKPLEFEHGTTTLSFIFEGGVIAAVDSRASLGNFVGSKTVEKVLPINR